MELGYGIGLWNWAMELGDGIGLWNWAIEYHTAYSATVSHGYTIAQPDRLFCGPVWCRLYVRPSYTAYMVPIRQSRNE
jgi:hypothetical protein